MARSDTDPVLRADAFEVLRALTVTEAIAVALDHLDDDDQRVRTAALLLVGRARRTGHSPIGFSPASTTPIPQSARRRPPPSGLTGARAVGESLLDVLTDDDHAVQREAVLALGRVGDASTAVTLLRCLDEATPEVRVAIATAVTRLDVAQVPALLDRLVEPGDLQSKLAVIATVAEVRAPAASAALRVLQHDPDAAVRAALVRLWWHHPDLVDATRSSAWPATRWRRSGSRWRPPVPPVAPRRSLSALIADPAVEVRAMAAVAGLLTGLSASLPPDIPRAALTEAATTALPVSELHRRAASTDMGRRMQAGIVLALLDDPMAHRMAIEDPAPALRSAVRAALPDA